MGKKVIKTELLPPESMVLTVANGMVRQNRPIPPNTAVALVLTLNRLVGEKPTLPVEELRNHDKQS